MFLMALLMQVLVFFLLVIGSYGNDIVLRKEFDAHEIGSSFELRCDIGVNKTLKSLNWLRNDGDELLIFYHSIVQKRSAITKDNQPFYDIIIADGAYILKIVNVRQEFAKRHSCVKVIEGDGSSRDIFVLSMKTDTYVKDIGDNLNVPCFPVDVSNESNHYAHGLGIWSKRQGDIIPVNGSYIRNFRDPIHNKLNLTDLKISDTGFYSCYNRGFKIRTIDLQVYDQEKQSESQSLRFQCSEDPLDIKMISKDNRVIYFDGQFLTRKEIYRLDEEGYITMTSASFDNSGVYKCYNGEALLNVYNLTVSGGFSSNQFISHEPGTADLATSSSQLDLGVDALLTCSFNDKWKIVYWKYNGVIIHIVSNDQNASYFSTNHFFSVPTSTKQDLTLLSITTYGLGKYQCIVQYNHHYSQSNIITLKNSPVNVKFKQPSTMKELSCDGSQNTPFWFINDTLINIGENVIIKPNHFQISGTKLILKLEYYVEVFFSCFSHESIQRQWKAITESIAPVPNTNQTNSTTPSLTIDAPQNLVIVSSSNVIEPSSNIVLTCGVDVFQNDSIVYWFSRSQLVFLKSQNVTWALSSKYGSHQFGNELRIVNVQEVDVEKTYECYIMNKDGNVNKSLPFTLPSFKTDSKYEQSNFATLTCNKDAIFWLGANKEALLSFYDRVIDDTYSVGSDGTLFVNRIGEEQKGIYHCLSGTNTTRTVHFNYENKTDDKVGKNLIVTNSLKMNTSLDGKFEFGQKMSFHCHHQFPADLVYWRYEGSEIFFVDSREKKWSKYNDLIESTSSNTKDTLVVNYLTNSFKGKFECFAVQSGLIYKSQKFLVNEIKQNVVKTGLKLSQDGNTLLCEVTDSTLNSSGIFWTKDDKLQYATFDDSGEKSTKVDKKYSGEKRGSIYRLTISGDITSGNYACSTYKEKYEKEYFDSTETKPRRYVHTSNILTIEFKIPGNQYQLRAVLGTAKSGSSLSLQCTYPLDIGEPEYVYWAEEGGNEEKFILIHSNEAFRKSYYDTIAVPGFVIPQSTQFSLNSDCRFTKGCTKIVIESASEGHNSKFWCMVKPKGQALKKSTDTNLNEENFNPTTRPLVDFKKRETISCGNDKPKQGIWLKDDSLLAIDDQLVEKRDDITINKSLALELKNFTSESQGQYECYSRKNGTLMKTWIVYLVEPEVKVKFNDKPQLGRDLTMVCSYDYLDPELAFWEKKGANGQKQFIYFSGANNAFNKSSRIIGTEGEAEMTMTMYGLTENDMGEYTCHVQLGQDYKEEKRLLSISKTVQTISVKEPVYQVSEGTDIVIFCHIDEQTIVNKVSEVLWFKNNRLIARKGNILWDLKKYELNITSNGLIMKDLNLSDSDTYRCYFRGILFHSFALSVQAKPIITVKPPSTLQGQNGYFLGFGLAILIFGLLGLSWYMTRSRGPLLEVNVKD